MVANLNQSAMSRLFGILVFVILHAYQDTFSVNGGDVSAYSIHDLRLNNVSLTGYPVKIHVEFCTCDCDKQAALTFFNRKYDKKKCDEMYANSEGICVIKHQEEMFEDKFNTCYQRGHAVCLFKFTTPRVYRAMSLDDDVAFLRVIFDANNSIDLPHDTQQFIWQNTTYTIYGIDRRQPEYLYPPGIYYQEKTDNKFLWRDESQAKDDTIKLRREDWPLIFNDTSSEKLAEKIKLHDDAFLSEHSCPKDSSFTEFDFQDNGKIIKAGFESYKDIGVKHPVINVEIKKDRVEIFDKKFEVRAVDVNSRKTFFFFAGTIRNGSDGQQYIVITNNTHNETMLNGFIGLRDREYFQIVPGKNFVPLKKEYTTEQVVCLQPIIGIKTCQVIIYSTERFISQPQEFSRRGVGSVTSLPSTISVTNNFDNNISSTFVNQNDMANVTANSTAIPVPNTSQKLGTAEIIGIVFAIIVLTIICFLIYRYRRFICKPRSNHQQHLNGPDGVPEMEALNAGNAEPNQQNGVP